MHSMITSPAAIAVAILAIVFAAILLLRRDPTPVETELEKLETKRRVVKRTGQIPSQLDIYEVMCSNEQKRWSVEELSKLLRLDGFGQRRALNPLVKRHLRRLASRGIVSRIPRFKVARRHEQQFAFQLAA